MTCNELVHFCSEPSISGLLSYLAPNNHNAFFREFSKSFSAPFRPTQSRKNRRVASPQGVIIELAQFAALQNHVMLDLPLRPTLLPPRVNEIGVEAFTPGVLGPRKSCYGLAVKRLPVDETIAVKSVLKHRVGGDGCEGSGSGDGCQVVVTVIVVVVDAVEVIVVVEMMVGPTDMVVTNYFAININRVLTNYFAIKR
jgi:hypothetical protein